MEEPELSDTGYIAIIEHYEITRRNNLRPDIWGNILYFEVHPDVDKFTLSASLDHSPHDFAAVTFLPSKGWDGEAHVVVGRDAPFQEAIILAASRRWLTRDSS